MINYDQNEITNIPFLNIKQTQIKHIAQFMYRYFGKNFQKF